MELPSGIFILAILRDISEKKRAEEKLAESEKKYRKMFENAQIALFRTTISEGIFIEGNQMMAEILGYSSVDEMIGIKSVASHYKDIEDRYRLMAVLREHGEIKNAEIEFRKKDGSLCWLRFTAVMNLEVGCVEGFAADITQKKEAEIEINKIKSLVSNIIDSMPSILIAIDADGCVTQWNKTTEESTSVLSIDALGKRLERVFPGLNETISKIMDSVNKHEVMQISRLKGRLKEKVIYQDVTVYPLTDAHAEGAVIRIDDVTEYVQMEEMMIQSEKMLSLGGLAAGMAHEINNPLAGIMQTTHVVHNRLISNFRTKANQKAAEKFEVSLEKMGKFMTDRKIPELLDAIHLAGSRIAEIVSNMLSFSRKSSEDKKSCDLTSLMDKTLELAMTDYDLKKQYDFKSVRIMREYQDNLPEVACEAGKIQQVLLNLFRNGAQAMQDPGTDCPTLTLRVYKKDEKRVAIEVEDNGPGMEEGVRKRVFEPFFTTKPPGIGTGLGLSVSYFIIRENHHGDLRVESALGRGAKFIIELPIQ